MTQPLSSHPQQRKPYRWLLAAASCWFLLVLFFESATGNNGIGEIVVQGGGLALILSVLIGGARLLIRVIRHQALTYPRQRVLVYAFVIAVLLGAVWLARTHQAVLWRIKLNEAPLLAFVQQQQAAQRNVDSWVGLFWIERSEVHGDTVWMVTQSCGLFGDECGLVYSPRGEPPYISEASYGHLDGPWWIWRRSW